MLSGSKSVEVKNLSKTFRKKRQRIIALEKVSFYLEKGKTLSILGPSGAGKTTLLKIIAGLEKHDMGEIFFDEERVDQLPARERNVAMVFQNYALYPHMNVYDNLYFPLKMTKVPRNQAHQRVIQIAKMLEIEDLLTRKPKELSGGQRQRVALGRALVKSPTVLLMDEPLSNVDVRLKSKLRAEIASIIKNFNQTTILVTHNQEDALSMGDILGIIIEGKLQEYGPVEEVYSKPSSLKAASFLGDPQPTTVEFSVENSHLLLDGIIRMSISGKAEALKEIRDGFAVLRSENLETVPPEENEPNTFEARVVSTDFRGGRLILTVSAGDKTLSVQIGAGMLPKTGERVKVKIKEVLLYTKEGTLIDKFKL